MPASKEEIVRRVKELDRANKKESREAREYEEMKWRPISWSEEMKDVARKDKDNPLAGQYLWMDDENALGSAAWIEKGINKTLRIDPTKKFEWDRWMRRSLPDKAGELGWEFVKGAANTIPSLMRVVSSGAYSASKLVSAPPKLIDPTLTEATGKMVTTGIKEAIENPAGFAGGMVGIIGVAGGLAKAAKVGVRGARKAGKLRGKGKKETSALNVLKEEKGTHPKVKVETQKSPKNSASSKRVEGKRETQPSARIAREEKGEKNKQMKNDRSEGRKKREEERKKREDERRKREEEKRKKREEERRKQEERRKKREEIRKKQKKEKLKKECGRKPKKARKPHRRLKKIVKRAKIPRNGASSARNPRGKTAGRSAKKSYRRKEIINQLPWL